MTPPAEHSGPCETCPFHEKQVFRIDENEKDIKKLYDTVEKLSKEVAATNTVLAVLTQKFENLKIPIWVIFGVALTQLGKMIFSFIPATTNEATTVLSYLW